MALRSLKVLDKMTKKQHTLFTTTKQSFKQVQ